MSDSVIEASVGPDRLGQMAFEDQTEAQLPRKRVNAGLELGTHRLVLDLREELVQLGHGARVPPA